MGELSPLWAATFAGVFGLLIGSFLNVVVWRVPRGESLLPDSRCPSCSERIRPLHNVPVIAWIALRGKCAHCTAPISIRYPLVELGTGIAFALVTLWVVTGAEPRGTEGSAIVLWLTLAAMLWFAAVSIALTLIDIDHQRLPNDIVLPSLAVVATLLTVAAILTGDLARVISTLGGAAALFAVYFVIVVVYPKGMGGGDVKLAPLIGAVLGFIGWPEVAIGGFAGFVFGAMWGIALMAFRSAKGTSKIPFGPFMLVGAWVGLVWGDTIWQGYLNISGLG